MFKNHSAINAAVYGI